MKPPADRIDAGVGKHVFYRKFSLIDIYRSWQVFPPLWSKMDYLRLSFEILWETERLYSRFPSVFSFPSSFGLLPRSVSFLFCRHQFFSSPVRRDPLLLFSVALLLPYRGSWVLLKYCATPGQPAIRCLPLFD